MWRHERRLCVTNIITLDSSPTERKSDKTQNKEDSELFFCDGFMMLQTGAVNHLYIYLYIYQILITGVKYGTRVLLSADYERVNWDYFCSRFSFKQEFKISLNRRITINQFILLPNNYLSFIDAQIRC